MNRIVFIFMSLVICGGCVNGSVEMDDVASGVVAAVTGLAAHELAPDNWTDPEKAGLAAATAATSFIIGKSIAGGAKKNQEKAFQEGFKGGMAYGARRQFEIVQAMQRDDRYSSRNVYAIPAPVTAGINKVPYNVYLEVTE
jgi:hypothetical protein